ncbi:hypothetical protein NO559_07710 [Dasania sp. GY-MA-18]|uniref:Uncharacterized protein n=1 Tax=Dasania phycosphaerae TaxID=2950436 RepID=A0A9J6RL08_9GAMM|nr:MULTISPECIES: hypothetical protein [Dasania]MCR8922652.1 hypothetical protein [Dasania sp. GY-MA-18]MCZ0865082.1 hypothetical protein [Dasania phycosphaerae]MCZ0868808.1 hypothetical protein [Dasania phycosphaerae]
MAIRLATKAKIKRATQAAQAQTTIADGAALNDLKNIYQRAVDELRAKVNSYADGSGSVRLTAMRNLLADSERILKQLRQAQDTALFERMEEVAALGVDPFAEQLGVRRVSAAAKEAVKVARNFVAADGLQLSDRLWRVNNSAKEAVGRAIQNAVIQGQSASEAAQEFLRTGEPVPAALNSKMEQAQAGKINRVLGQQLMTGEGSAYHNARRVFRTEINRAHGTAFKNAAFDVEGVIGTRFLLSPNHPETDICDLHAKANIYGLGAGVYPKGKSPWPAHPNTISYEVAVFEDEVSEADKAGKQSASEWLATQPYNVQAGVLGVNKQRAFAAGVLANNEIKTPWRVLKNRYLGKGVNTTTFTNIPREVGAVARKVIDAASINPFSARATLPFKNSLEQLRSHLSQYALGLVNVDGITSASAYSLAAGIDKVLGLFNNSVGRIQWFARAPKGAVGGYAHPRTQWTPKSDELFFKKSYITKGYKNEPAEHLAYLAKRDKELAAYDKRIASNDGHLRNVAIKNREKLAAATRWSASSIADNPVFAVAAHEAGHVLYYQGRNIPELWQRQLIAQGATDVDWFAVSEYGATNHSELFAEVTAFMAMGRENLLPASIVKAYTETLKNYQRWDE